MELEVMFSWRDGVYVTLTHWRASAWAKLRQLLILCGPPDAAGVEASSDEAPRAPGVIVGEGHTWEPEITLRWSSGAFVVLTEKAGSGWEDACQLMKQYGQPDKVRLELMNLDGTPMECWAEFKKKEVAVGNG